jgi:hypothetical protein
MIRTSCDPAVGLAIQRGITPLGQRYSSEVQQPWRIQVDAGGRVGTSDLLKQLVRRRLPVATDQKVGGSSPSERATETPGQRHILRDRQGAGSFA